MMRHNILPLARAGVLLLLGGLGSSACSDSTGPSPGGPQLVRSLETPPTDSPGQLGVALSVARSDSALLREVRIYVDSAAGVSPVAATTFGFGSPQPVYWSVITLPGPGRHTVSVIGVDTIGRALSATAAWTVRLATDAYSVRVLPDSGNGGGTRFVHADGTVTGWVRGPTGHVRPALWRDGVLTVVGPTDSLDGVATRVNAAGDVLLQYYSTSQRGALVRVRRADGMTFVVGPSYGGFVTDDGRTITYSVCCNEGVDLTETRRAVGNAGGIYSSSGYRSLIFDVAGGVLVDSISNDLAAMNDAGQSVGSNAGTSGPGISVNLFPHGFETTPLPDGVVTSLCDPIGRSFSLRPIDLDDGPNVLASYCGTAVWLPPAGGTSRWLDRLFGRSKAIHLSRTGQIIASLDSAGTIYLWRSHSDRTSQVQIAGSRWQIDSLAAVNAAGQIAAHGVERTTGRGAALLLTPAATP